MDPKNNRPLLVGSMLMFMLGATAWKVHRDGIYYQDIDQILMAFGAAGLLWGYLTYEPRPK